MESSSAIPAGPSTVHGVVSAALARRPDAVAVRDATGALTGARLERASNHLANWLAQRGVGPGRYVAVVMAPSVRFVVTVLAVLKAGAAYVPLDPALPQRRLAMLLDDLGPVPVLHEEDPVPATFGAAGAVPLALPPTFGAADTGPGVDVDPGQPCYAIFTSGSTGTPRAAINQHRGVVNSIRGVADLIGITPGTRALQVSSVAWDMSVFELYGTLAAGAELIVPGTADRRAPDRLLALLTGHRVQLWSSAPAVLRAVLARAEEVPGCLDALRTVLLGGDRIPPEVIRRLHALAPSATLYNLAGVTEVSYCSTAYRVRPEDADRASVPWGRPLPGQWAYVLDERGVPVPDGQTGELHLGGTGVGLGYWRRPELTASRFLPDPFTDGPDAVMYRTGDLVHRNAAGDLEFLGRADGQVKVGGVRIETGEVESVLETHPGVEAAVVVAAGTAGDLRLVAYAKPRAGARPPSRESCRAWLVDRLTPELVPHHIVLLDSLPTTPNGKIDRRALAARAPEPVVSPAAPADPASVATIGEVFARVLNVPSCTGEDNFFELGGDSLLAIEAVRQVRDRTGRPVALRTLFDAPTPRQLAAVLGDGDR